MISLGPLAAYGRRMSEFMIELYVSRSDRGAVLEHAERARMTAGQLRGEGSAIRLLLTIFVPEDETCFLVYEAASVDSVRRSAHLAGLPVEHIVEAFILDDD